MIPSSAGRYPDPRRSAGSNLLSGRKHIREI
jgi:hypothetical protein